MTISIRDLCQDILKAAGHETLPFESLNEAFFLNDYGKHYPLLFGGGDAFDIGVQA